MFLDPLLTTWSDDVAYDVIYDINFLYAVSPAKVIFLKKSLCLWTPCWPKKLWCLIRRQLFWGPLSQLWCHLRTISYDVHDLCISADLNWPRILAKVAMVLLLRFLLIPGQWICAVTLFSDSVQHWNGVIKPRCHDCRLTFDKTDSDWRLLHCPLLPPHCRLLSSLFQPSLAFFAASAWMSWR